jgi:hypothetical protein
MLGFVFGAATLGRRLLGPLVFFDFLVLLVLLIGMGLRVSTTGLRRSTARAGLGWVVSSSKRPPVGFGGRSWGW